MTTDLKMLALTAGFTAVMWLPYILAQIVNAGLMPVLTYTADTTPLPAWAARAKRAHYNAIENLVPFAALIIVAQLTNSANEATATAAIIYFWARVAHYLLYAAAVPFGRTLAFTAGWVATAWVFWEIVSPIL